MRLIADEEVADGDGELSGFVGAEVVQFFLEASGVGGEVAEGDWRVAYAAVAGVDGEVEVAADVGVEVELALFDELHHGDVGEELGDGAGAEGCGDGVDWCLLLPVGVAIAFEDEGLAILRDGDGGAGDVVALELQREKAVEEGGDVLRCERRRGGGISW